MKIYTRTGDTGDTALFGGGRVAKDHPRVEAYGEVDELNAALGLARAIEALPRIDEVLAPVQRDLFGIGALLATPDHAKMREQLRKARIDEARIAELEAHCDVAQICGLLSGPAADRLRLGARRTGRLLSGLRRALVDR